MAAPVRVWRCGPCSPSACSARSAAVAGFVLLQGHLTLTATIMAFAAGGILYLVFQDIAPQARMRRHWTPALGAVLGFVVGMLGKQVLG